MHSWVAGLPTQEERPPPAVAEGLGCPQRAASGAAGWGASVRGGTDGAFGFR